MPVPGWPVSPASQWARHQPICSLLLPTYIALDPATALVQGPSVEVQMSPATFCFPPRADTYLALCCPVGKQGTHPRTSPWSVAQSESGPLQEYLWNRPRASRCQDRPGEQTSGIALYFCSLLTSLSRYGAGWWDTTNPDLQACLHLCLFHPWTHIPVLQVSSYLSWDKSFQPHFPHLMWK